MRGYQTSEHYVNPLYLSSNMAQDAVSATNAQLGWVVPLVSNVASAPNVIFADNPAAKVVAQRYSFAPQKRALDINNRTADSESYSLRRPAMRKTRNTTDKMSATLLRLSIVVAFLFFFCGFAFIYSYATAENGAERSNSYALTSPSYLGANTDVRATRGAQGAYATGGGENVDPDAPSASEAAVGEGVDLVAAEFVDVFDEVDDALKANDGAENPFTDEFAVAEDDRWLQEVAIPEYEFATFEKVNSSVWESDARNVDLNDSFYGVKNEVVDDLQIASLVRQDGSQPALANPSYTSFTSASSLVQNGERDDEIRPTIEQVSATRPVDDAKSRVGGAEYLVPSPIGALTRGAANASGVATVRVE